MDRTVLEKNTMTNTEKNAVTVVPVLNVEELFDGLREIRLSHGSEEYRLRLTKKDKLILTK